MSISYLPPGGWAATSRDERFFCQALFRHIQGREQQFVRFINETGGTLKLDHMVHWEVGFEVCFYRDLMHARPELRSDVYSLKRTFDLALFSEKQVVILEAKAHERFNREQSRSVAADKKKLLALLEPVQSVIAVAIASSIYLKNATKYGDQEILQPFDAKVSWHSLYNGFIDEPLFLRADGLYKPLRRTDA